VAIKTPLPLEMALLLLLLRVEQTELYQISERNGPISTLNNFVSDLSQTDAVQNYGNTKTTWEMC